MKKLSIMALLVLLTACGDLETVRLTAEDGSDGTQGTSCSVEGNTLTCGNDTFGLDDLKGDSGNQGPAGNNGNDGVDGSDAVILTIVDMPVAGACYAVAPGLFAENEGNTKADLYNNDQCDHGPTPNKVLCDNLHSDDDDNGAGEICAVDNYIFIVEGGYSAMQMYVLDFN